MRVRGGDVQTSGRSRLRERGRRGASRLDGGGVASGEVDERRYADPDRGRGESPRAREGARLCKRGSRLLVAALEEERLSQRRESRVSPGASPRVRVRARTSRHARPRRSPGQEQRSDHRDPRAKGRDPVCKRAQIVRRAPATSSQRSISSRPRPLIPAASARTIPSCGSASAPATTGVEPAIHGVPRDRWRSGPRRRGSRACWLDRRPCSRSHA